LRADSGTAFQAVIHRDRQDRKQKAEDTGRDARATKKDAIIGYY